jgi:hypothetical protein
MTPSITPTAPAASQAVRPLAIPYTTAGGEKRQAVIGRDESDAWCVYDTPAARTGRVVARLEGADEDAEKAAFLAADYVAEQIAYAKGERTEDPLPKAEEKRLGVILADMQRASSATAVGDGELPEWFVEILAALIRAQAEKEEPKQSLPSTTEVRP